MGSRMIINNFFGTNYLVRKTILNKSLRKLTGNRADCFKTGAHTGNTFINLVNIKNAKNEVECLTFDDGIVEKYLNREFNLLGSGWIKWEYGAAVPGYRGCRVSEIISSDNKDNNNRIAWNVDVRSGYEFTKTYFDSQLISQLPEGVEIKVPWEIGRMYHWPYLALYSLKKEKDFSENIIEEFKSQMTDYIEQNPVGKGVQYYCPMEAAIRAVNLLFAYDVLKQTDENGILNENFRKGFEGYLFDMAGYIEHNIEFDLSGRKNGNHYLSDLLGLLWIYAYFGKDGSFKKIKALFLDEVASQFFDDGSNFECSASYHRLSSEISALGILMIAKKCGSEAVTDEIKKRLIGMKRFLVNCTGSDGRLTQIGDNDSGRVFKLLPVYFGEVEDTLRITDITDLIDGLFGNSENRFSFAECYDAAGLKTDCENGNPETVADISDCSFGFENAEFFEETVLCVPPECSFEHKKYIFEKKFGLITVRGENGDLFIRALPDYQAMNVAHSHEDAFHYELCVGSRRMYADCGSVSYTSNTKENELFRSAAGHNVPVHGHKPLSKTKPFEAVFDSTGKMTVAFSKNSVILNFENSEYKHTRVFIFDENRIIVRDYSDDSFRVNKVSKSWYSLGYGHINNCQINEDA